MKCPFCEIDKERTRIIKEKNNVFVILSNPRLVEGHLLVVPKRHVEKLSELTEEEKKELFGTVIEFQEKILSKISKGCDIRQNYRPFQKEDGLKVNHLHIHLLPRELYDELYTKCQKYETDIFKKLNKEDLEKFYNLFSD